MFAPTAWESSWPEWDYTIPTGNMGYLGETDEPREPKPRFPIGFQVPSDPETPERTRRPNSNRSKKPGVKTPDKRKQRKPPRTK